MLQIASKSTFLLPLPLGPKNKRKYCHWPMTWDMSWKLWPEISAKMKNLTNYNFDDINESMDIYVDLLFDERYKQWKSDLHKHYELLDDPEVTLEEGCPLKLEDRPNKWVWLCGHFQDPAYMILIETLDATLGRRLGKYCRVIELTHELAYLRSKLALIVEALSSNDICLPPVVTFPSTSEPHNSLTSEPRSPAQPSSSPAY
ncbi:hypothetical protein D8674_008392 [Pyrus ussuriensis x Pyrus communis]|uniref:Uncharacterized protein n=1 Tax=Pyrus ussuriensis x Pyrus communis TaxID=2448454 RepID=A0A5N5HVP4_9ROSA|nr:hypothetical protein D8674_008392 [Pyrus ussuriensis x Pyrus communis]